MAQLEIQSKGFAIDTWEGDEHTGYYDEQVLVDLLDYHDPRYAGFSRLVRSTFDDAVEHFEDGSIDLLHIDGLHTYEAVRHDYERWRPKLSSRAVVLLHDTNVHEHDFGVHRLWAELIEQHPSFEFVHGHGLGVLGIGTEISGRVKMLLRSGSDDQVAATRAAYARLGSAIRLSSEVRELSKLLEQERSTAIDQIAKVHAELTSISTDLAARSAAVGTLESTVSKLQEELSEQVDALEHQLSVVLTSESWRVTAPLRIVGRAIRTLVPGSGFVPLPSAPVDSTPPYDMLRESILRAPVVPFVPKQPDDGDETGSPANGR